MAICILNVLYNQKVFEKNLNARLFLKNSRGWYIDNQKTIEYENDFDTCY